MIPSELSTGMALRQALRAKTVWLMFWVHTLVVFGAGYYALRYVPHPNPPLITHLATSHIPLVQQFMRWDVDWYIVVAAHGYKGMDAAFFPLLPALIRLVHELGLGYGNAGFLVANAFAFLSFVFMYALFRIDFSERQTGQAMLVYALFPTSFFLNTVYTEAPFMALSLACLYFARKRAWGLAGLAGAGATLTRNLGVFLAVALVYEAWIQWRTTKRLSVSMLLGMALLPLALLLFMGYLGYVLRDPLAFVHAQSYWDRQPALPWDNVRESIHLILTHKSLAEFASVLDLAATLGTFVALGVETVWRRLGVRVSYLVVGWISFLIPLFSKGPVHPLYSLSRFILVLFAIYPFFGRWPRWLLYPFVVLSGALLVVATIKFTSWTWVA